MGEVALQGKTLVDPSITIHRSTGGISASYARIMEVLRAPTWLKGFPSLTLVFGISLHVALKSEAFRASYPWGRFLVAPLILGTLVVRLIVKPFVGRCKAAARRTLLARY
jgi:hypothetical protein